MCLPHPYTLQNLINDVEDSWDEGNITLMVYSYNKSRQLQKLYIKVARDPRASNCCLFFCSRADPKDIVYIYT